MPATIPFLWETITALLLVTCLVQGFVIFSRLPSKSEQQASGEPKQPAPSTSAKGKEKEKDEATVGEEERPPRKPRHPKKDMKWVGVVLGSGGHTTEALTLLSALNFQEYFKRRYIISSGDTLSYEKAMELESKKSVPGQPGESGTFNVTYLPRARRVHQSLITTPLTAARSFYAAFLELVVRPVAESTAQCPEPFSDVLIMTGPGTCVSIALAIQLGRLIGFGTPDLVYVESFARVKRLSLTGKILRWGLVDKFVVQWPELERVAGKNADYRGLLV